MKRLLLLTIVSAGLFLACENSTSHNHGSIPLGYGILNRTDYDVNVTTNTDRTLFANSNWFTVLAPGEFGVETGIVLENGVRRNPVAVQISNDGETTFIQYTPRWQLVFTNTHNALAVIISENYMCVGGWDFSEIEVPAGVADWIFPDRRAFIYTDTPNFQRRHLGNVSPIGNWVVQSRIEANTMFVTFAHQP
ncbi:MAG: hypothetical protein FWC64_09675 [Treponema sp.]|nr:hypothetical protein [Treponema sp.]